MIHPSFQMMRMNPPKKPLAALLKTHFKFRSRSSWMLHKGQLVIWHSKHMLLCEPINRDQKEEQGDESLYEVLQAVTKGPFHHQKDLKIGSLKNGMFSSKSLRSSSVTLLKEKCCNNYRNLNSVIIENCPTPSHVDALPDSRGGSKLSPTLMLKSMKCD